MIINEVKEKVHGALPEKVLQIGEGNFCVLLWIG